MVGEILSFFFENLLLAGEMLKIASLDVLLAGEMLKLHLWMCFWLGKC